MAYTVKQLAKISGVSVRTLHWYDEKGLLKPAYCTENGYRYYEEKQLFALQQILFFRELGFSLRDIQSLLLQNSFDLIKALKAHKQILTQDRDRKTTLIATIDNTISRLQGVKTMDDTQLYYGFDSSRQKEYKQYIVHEYGTKAEELLKQSQRKTATWNADEWDSVKKDGDALHTELTLAIDKQLCPYSKEVQAIIERHFALQSRFFDLTKEVYIGLADLYATHPDFKKFFEAYHPNMIDYLGKAIKHYAEKNL